MHALAGQRVEEYGERRHEGLAFARRHLGDLALVEHHAAEQLHVVVDHVPLHVVASGEPVGGVDGLVALDGDEILRRGEVAVEIVGRHHDRIVLGEAARRVFHDGERLGENLVEHLFDFFVDAFGGLVDLLRDLLLLFELRFGFFERGFQFDDAGFVRGDEVGDLFFQGLAAGAQFVVRERLDRGVDGLDLFEIGFDLFAVLVGFRTEKGFDYACKNIHKVVVVSELRILNPTKIVIIF